MTALAIYRAALRDLLSWRRLIPSVLLVILPGAIALIWRATMPAEDFDAKVVYNVITSGLVFGFALVILSVVFGTGAALQELEQKTIVYLLTRPISRRVVLAAKMLAALTLIIATVWLSMTLLWLTTFGMSGGGIGPLKQDLWILTIGALAYTSVFVAVATITNRALVIGLFFAFGWEFWVPNWPGSFQKVSLMAHLRVLAPHPQPPSDMVDIKELLAVLSPTTISDTYAWTVLLVTTAVALVTAFLVFSIREYVPKESAE